MSIWDDIGAIFTGPASVVNDAVTFLQWIAWLFNPINWVRMVEFVVGIIMMLEGLRMVVRQRVPSPGTSAARTIMKLPVVRDIPQVRAASKVKKG